MPSVDLPGGRIKLGMSVGAHSGELLLAAAGSLEERVQLFAIGDTAAETAAAEAQAARGELVVTTQTAAQLPLGWKLRHESGRLRVLSGRPVAVDAGAGLRQEPAWTEASPRSASMPRACSRSLRHRCGRLSSQGAAPR